MNAKALDSVPPSMRPVDLAGPAHVVAIAGSAGAFKPLKVIIDALPRSLNAAVLVVVHYPPEFESALPQLLARSASLPVSRAREGERIEAGHVYVAPAGRHHLTVEGTTLHLRPGPPVHRHSPAADPLFQSLSHAFGKRSIGVVLSGADANGAAGLREVELAGGAALIQSPKEAQHARMPESALANTRVNLCAPARELAMRLVELCGRKAVDAS
jgi:two-component system chemotaxis response regulator CheB